ncbi:hypothetical protein [Sphingobacterium sp. LRF_L2]|uniref:hypothetical protein n=1 Tax=Sphingobacterium sp. LRF_L2 TaxID=3369421 RepID=UPI003F60274A
MKIKHLLITVSLGLLLISCSKDDKPVNENLPEKVLLKNGKEYLKDSVLNKLSLYTQVQSDSIVYDSEKQTFFLKDSNFEIDAIFYLQLK